MATRVECIDVVKRFGNAVVLDHLNWTVPAGCLLGLLGGSGVGKTTLLRLIAGLDRCSSGEVRITACGPDKARPHGPIGMVFQNLALWPHLTARQHVECVLWRLARKQRRSRAEAVLAETKLPPAARNRRPAQLSGGEGQRLALARALAPQPELLLLDEPLARVDAPLRAELLDLLREVIAARRVTAVYVTHHWREVLQLCERIAVIHDGRIAMDAAAEQVFWSPPTAHLARLTGPVVELPTSLLDEGLIARAKAPPRTGPGVWAEADRLVVRPQQLRVISPQGRNRWQVADCRPEGSGWTLTVLHEDHRLSVTAMAQSSRGETVGLELMTTPPPAS